MNILTALEISVVALLVAFFVMQIIVPIFRARPMFPFFSRQADLLKKQAEARQRKDEDKLREHLKK